MSEIKCPRCGSTNITSERQLDGFRECKDCGYRWQMGTSEDKINKLTPSSKELDALNLMYSISRHLIPIAQAEEFDKAYKIVTRGLIINHYDKKKKSK